MSSKGFSQQSHASCSPQINRSVFMQMSWYSLLDFIQTVIKRLGKSSRATLIAGYTRAFHIALEGLAHYSCVVFFFRRPLIDIDCSPRGSSIKDNSILKPWGEDLLLVYLNHCNSNNKNYA